MNTQNVTWNQEQDISQEKVINETRLREMEDEIELLREQVESLKQELYNEYQRTNEYIQELDYAHQELEWMNKEISHLVASNVISSHEAKSVVKQKNAPTVSVTKLVNTIDSFPAQVNSSKLINNSSITKIEQFKEQCREARAKSYQLRANFSQILAQSYKLTSQSKEIRGCVRETRVHTQEVRKQLASAIGSGSGRICEAKLPGPMLEVIA